MHEMRGVVVISVECRLWQPWTAARELLVKDFSGKYWVEVAFSTGGSRSVISSSDLGKAAEEIRINKTNGKTPDTQIHTLTHLIRLLTMSHLSENSSGFRL